MNNNTVIYARYSSHSQNEQSIETQIKVCRDYAEKHNLNVIDIYYDKAKTGTNDNREYFQKMIDDSNKKIFKYVLVYNLSRFARNTQDSVMNEIILEKNGVNLISAYENISGDDDDPVNALMKNMMRGVNEYYSKYTAKNIRDGLKTNAMKGLSIGGRSLPLGYKSNDEREIYVDEEEAKIVKKIFEMFKDKKTYADIIRYLNLHNVKTKIGNEFNKSSIKRILTNKKYIGVKQNEAKYFIEMNLYQNHFFLEETTPFSCYYIKNIEKENEENYKKEYVEYRNIYRKARAFCRSGELIKLLFEKGYFVPITYGHYLVLNTEFHKFQDSNSIDYDLHYDEDYCSKLITKQKDIKKDNQKIFFADFESDVSGDTHRPFLCVLQNENGTETKVFKEGSCGKDLLDYLPNNSITYFHNLAYDIRMIAHFGICKSIIKGTRCLSAKIIWKNKALYFKDSLALFNCKLSQLPSMFGLNNIEKELFPYKYYTYTKLAESEILTDNDDVISVGTISEAGVYEDKPWGEEEYSQFKLNIEKIGALIGENQFDMYKYAEFYCMQDVRILRESFNIFRAGFKSDFNIDVFNFISISSLANEVFRQNVYIPNQKLYKLGGHVRHFCSKAVYGGRCMCAFNKKWQIKANFM